MTLGTKILPIRKKHYEKSNKKILVKITVKDTINPDVRVLW
jgi:hypothetical protein